MRRVVAATLTLLATTMALIVAAGAWLYWRQESLLFQPAVLPSHYAFELPGVEEMTIPVAGATLSALHLKLPHPKGIVFYLHGNGGNLATWFVNSQFYREQNFDLFMFDYRGYGKSSGKIESEDQLRADVETAWNTIAPRYAGLRKVIFGRSLGTGMAARLAVEVGPDLTVLVSPYWSMEELSRVHYPIVPTSLLRYPLRTFQDIPKIPGNILVLHGDRDAVIPIGQAERLAAVARRAELVRVFGAGHNDMQQFPEYTGAIARCLGSL